MDNKVLEVALQAYMDGWCKSVEGTKRCIATWDDETDVAHARAGVRAALLAGVKVLLGPVVGYMDHEGYIWTHPDHAKDYFEETEFTVRPVYAPSLGEGE